MYTFENADLLAKIILIVGALNWGSVSAFDVDFVDQAIGKMYGSYVKMAVAAFAIYVIYRMAEPYFFQAYDKFMKKSEEPAESPAPETPAPQ